MDVLIEVKQLTKHFKVPVHHRGRFGALRNLVSRENRLVKAVDGISFEVLRGEIVSCIGPNGAGKSTTLKMLTGLLVPTKGDVHVDGMVPWRDRRRYVARIGAVFGQRTTLWWDLPVVESLEMLRHIYEIPENRFHNQLYELRNLLEMDEFINTPVRSLSLGQRMRADLCAAMLHSPALLFLDEPTIGLDVVAKERIRQFIQHINQTYSTTILLTTHDLSDVEKLSERVMIIDKGRILFNGRLRALHERFGGKRELVVDLAEDYAAIEVEGAEIVRREGNRVILQFERVTEADRGLEVTGSAISASELIARISGKYRIRDLVVREPNIEDTVRRIYEDRLLG